MKRLGVVVGVVCAPIALAVACSFPDPEIRDAVANEAGSDAPTTDGEVLVDGQTLDALVVDDAGSKLADAAGCEETCDCDGDGFYKPGHEDLCIDAGKGALDGGDCDDTDTRFRPNQGYVDIPTTGTTVTPVGDWNCDGTAEHLLPEDFACPAAVACSGEGFTSVVPCGQTGNFIGCSFAVFCVTQDLKSPTQACR